MNARSGSSLLQEPLFNPTDISRLLQLVADIADERGCTPAEVIDRMHRDAAALSGRPAPPSGFHVGQFVDRLRRARMRRNEVMGAQLFRDPAWDMLLDLFAAHEREQPVSVSALCFASGVPQSTALRAVARLEKHGMIEREGDPNDLRRSFVRATPKVLSGIVTMAGLFAEAFLASQDASA